MWAVINFTAHISLDNLVKYCYIVSTTKETVNDALYNKFRNVKFYANV
jgi:hypothetical protein